MVEVKDADDVLPAPLVTGSTCREPAPPADVRLLDVEVAEPEEMLRYFVFPEQLLCGSLPLGGTKVP